LALCLLWSFLSLSAQASPATSVQAPVPHQKTQAGRAAPGKESAKKAVPAASAIQFENVIEQSLIEQSKIKFTLKNSVSPQR
jgi:hypothetical protein